MDADTIKYLLLVRRRNLKSIAEELGVTLSAVSQTIHRVSPSRRIEKAIADAIGVGVEDVFPRRKVK